MWTTTMNMSEVKSQFQGDGPNPLNQKMSPAQPEWESIKISKRNVQQKNHYLTGAFEADRILVVRTRRDGI